MSPRLEILLIRRVLKLQCLSLRQSVVALGSTVRFVAFSCTGIKWASATSSTFSRVSTNKKMKILFLSGAALAQYAPPTTQPPYTGTTAPQQKGVQVKRNLR